MDALEILKSDHHKVRNLFELIRRSDSAEEKRDIFDRIKDELDLHSHLEETIFYPALADYDEVKELLEDSYEEHQEITDLLEEIDETDDEDEEAQGGQGSMFDDDIEELIDNVEYHVNKEEAELFPIVRRILSQADLDRLGALLSDSRQKLAAA